MQTPGPPPHPQAILDAEHLKLLSIFHYVLAGVAALFGSIPIFHVLFGVMIVNSKFPVPVPPPSAGAPATPPMTGFPEAFGWMFIVMGSAFILLSWTYAGLLFYSGRCLSARRKWTFSFVMACISCIHVPFGTALGVFTILVLQRPSVKALFDRPQVGGYLNS
ncbi:hypothetical protein [Luteolibacter soli]|uniref:Transmembrane protein n=1 Tax=Luteolibacter soli TaxID=3135280 RepID=A0ABU9B2K5_9BACT